MDVVMDSIAVGTSAQVVVSQRPYPRRVILRARTDQISVSTKPSVVGGGGWVIDPGEQTNEFDLPAGVTLYGIAVSAAQLSRTITG